MKHLLFIISLVILNTSLFLIFGNLLMDTIMQVSTLREIMTVVFVEKTILCALIYGAYSAIINGLIATLIYRKR